MGNSTDEKADIESFAISAGLAVNKIKPRRALRTQRELGKIEQITFTKIFAVFACSAFNKINRGGR